MKLRGSRTETILRRQLLDSELFINCNITIVKFLNKHYGEIQSVYVLTQTPEQSEDIYRLIINGDLVVGFELSRVNDQISEISDMGVNDYSKQLSSKSEKLYLAIALDLASLTH
ncbi:hypothetical protein [Limnobaculum xujianqingii]|uniref:hypothetical protein n=1 Tax=Limnobaculum xujianqingii TaxID=2738837 RepID=UPI00112D64C8|nr:hypothetical protein [Limnobaculum xujianqingii]